MKKLINKLLKDESGSLIWLIFAVMMFLIFVGVYQIGSIFVYRDRAVVRDAIDSACTSALTSNTIVEDHYTSFTEKHYKKKDKDGNVVKDYWKKKESGLEHNVYLAKEQAETTAKRMFEKIISTNNIHATLDSWNFTVEYDEERYIDVTQDRTNTSLASNWWAYDSDNGTSSVQFPRWVKVTITARVLVPVPMGGIIGIPNQAFTWKSQAIKEITPDRLS